MAVNEIEIGSGIQRSFQLRDYRYTQRLPEEPVQRFPFCGEAPLRQGGTVPGGVGEEHGYPVLPELPVLGIQRLQDIRLKGRRGVLRPGVKHLVPLSVWPWQNEVPVHIVGRKQIPVSVVVIAVGTCRIAELRHSGPQAQVFPQAVKYAGVDTQVQLRRRVVIGFHHGPEVVVDGVVSAELILQRIKFRRMEQHIPGIHVGPDQLQLGQGIGISKNPHVDHPILRVSRRNGRAVVCVAGGGTGKQHQLPLSAEGQEPVILVSKGCIVAGGKNGAGGGVHMNDRQVFTAIKAFIRDYSKAVEKIDFLRSAAGESPRFQFPHLG